MSLLLLQSKMCSIKFISATFILLFLFDKISSNPISTNLISLEKEINDCYENIYQSNDTFKCLNQAHLKWNINYDGNIYGHNNTKKERCCGYWDEMKCILSEAQVICPQIFNEVKETFNESVRKAEILMNCDQQIKYNGTECRQV